MAALSILRPGLFTTIQDLGRWGLQSRGVPVSGAMDWYSHRLANGLLKNDSTLATLEVTLMGPYVQFDAGSAFAVAGAEFDLTLDDAPVEMNTAIEARPGAVLRFGPRRYGARAYIAVTGGVDVPKVLGSRSTHALTAMGGHEGRSLRAGDTIRVGNRSDAPGPTSAMTSRPLPLTGSHARLRMIPADQQLAARLTEHRFRVSTRSDRMGYRLEGATVDAAPGEMVSVAIPTGAIQVPPTGQPILLMNDHATTGGYAIAGTVITADLPLAGQLAPGDSIEFEACSIDTARAALHQREAALDAG